MSCRMIDREDSPCHLCSQTSTWRRRKRATPPNCPSSSRCSGYTYTNTYTPGGGPCCCIRAECLSNEELEDVAEDEEDPPTWLYMTVWIASVAVYLNGLAGDFVHDDISAIKTNPDVLGTNHVSRVFFNDYWGKPMADPSSHKSYRPFTILTFRWNHSLFGLHPLGFHVVNVLLHSCACLLLTRVLLRLFNLSHGTVLSAGLIFATHPIHTEAVTGLVGRADVLAAITFLTAILTYQRAIEANVSHVRQDSLKVPKGRNCGPVEAISGNGTAEWEMEDWSNGGSSSSSEGGGGGGGGKGKRRPRTYGMGGCYECVAKEMAAATTPPCLVCVHYYSPTEESCCCSEVPGGNGLFRSEGDARAREQDCWKTAYQNESDLAHEKCDKTQEPSEEVAGDEEERQQQCPGEDEIEDRDEEKDWIKDEQLWVGLTGLVAAVGTLCKELAITSLAVCAAWDAICHRKHLKKIFQKHPPDKISEAILRRMVWLCIMGCIILTFRLWMLQGSSPTFSEQDNPAAYASSLLTRTLTFLYLPAFNTWLLLCPWRLSHDWQLGSIPLITSPTDVRNVASVAFYVVLLGMLSRGCIVKGEMSRVTLLSVAMVVLSFLPATNLFFTVGFVVAERILYIPSLGWSILVSIGANRCGRYRAPFLLLLLILFSCRTLLRNRDWESRATLFRAGLQILPNNAKMHYNFANLQKDLGNPALAKHHYREAIKLWPGHPSAHNNLGTLLNDTDEAEAHFRLALKTHPQHARAYYNLASIRQQQGNRDEAVSLLEESLRHDATNKDAVWALAGLYREAGRKTDAENLHLMLLGARPSDPVVHNNYAAFLHTIGRGDAALRHYELALDLDPRHTVALINTAKLMRTLQLDAQAELLYKRALAISWEAEVGESLGKLYLNTGRLEDAGDILSTVIRQNPEMLSSRVYLARVKLQQRNYLESEILLQDVLDQEPGHKEALFQLSVLYTQTNRTSQAFLVATHAAQGCLAPAALCAHLHAHYGDLLKDRQEIERAMESYATAVRLEPSLTHAYINLGALYHTKGEYSLARENYLKARSLDPNNSLLQENMEKLQRLQNLQHSSSSSSSSQTHHCLGNS
ncbi:protein O-mannosyl-transferase TMTC1-like [Macrobrachium rosenbergii]|uniref:protein O-mannosyl-transferase TMTC1-like n=1 Tax=Macrobrachium rosenbergii TaxID=79674 RepID=UPI0034D39837